MIGRSAYRRRWTRWLGAIAALSLALSLTGCARRIVLYGFEDEDFRWLKRGEAFTAPRDGAFLSDEYLREVAGARIERK